jgi:two-component system chemotaxis response regulator CheB
LPASIVIVQHMDPQLWRTTATTIGPPPGFSSQARRRRRALKPTRIYIAPPDNHLLIKKGKMLVTKARLKTGTDQDRSALSIGRRRMALALLASLTGMMDDGTQGSPP